MTHVHQLGFYFEGLHQKHQCESLPPLQPSLFLNLPRSAESLWESPTTSNATFTMKPDLSLVVFLFGTLGVSLLEDCPAHCQCDWDVYSVLCVGAEVMPVFPSSTQEV
ncbi:hypothetical protein EYF80_068348 [Liparis tanakae]|uniref:Uncharacterized protein n=1 Tax=Liparis tanakae TaxID=230148 RepID=A0A4Z2DZ70_9TELE|nr:hypothetical protein EYF80_068348 [Liparis tanakae]